MNEQERKSRSQRWLAKNKSRVIHPKYGEVVVPHLSKFSAIENAAEFWKCEVGDIITDAQVMWVENETPARRPKEFCRNTITEGEGNHTPR